MVTKNEFFTLALLSLSAEWLHLASCSEEKATAESTVVQGMIYCQSCIHKGTSSLASATPLPGAQVSIQCKDHKGRVSIYKVLTAGEGGYVYGELKGNFFARLAHHKINASSSCTAHLVHSPEPNCNMGSNLVNRGMDGCPLHYSKTISIKGNEVALYDFGPLAFRPTNCRLQYH